MPRFFGKLHPIATIYTIKSSFHFAFIYRVDLANSFIIIKTNQKTKKLPK